MAAFSHRGALQAWRRAVTVGVTLAGPKQARISTEEAGSSATGNNLIRALL